MKTKKISIILPTRNRSRLLTRAIQSVLEQSFKDWELIVIDDGSTDETPEILEQWQKTEPRLNVLRSEKRTGVDISFILNQGLSLASGKYVARLDDDDYWCHQDKLRKQFEFLESHPDYLVVGGGVIVVDEHEIELFRYFKKREDATIRRWALFANPFSHTTTMFRREEALAVGGYGDWHYAEDWDLWLKLGTRGKFYNFQEYFTVYRLADTNKSLLYQREQARAILEIIRRHRAEYPRFYGAYCLNLVQYLYSFLPFGLRKMLQPLLSSLKRSRF
jgi:glycosyltransferase involved in cell wall biosynthesis